MTKKKVCVSIPCYNETDNVCPMAEGLLELFATELPQYDVCIQFIDNNSNDGTQEKLRALCREHPQVRAILNARNFPMTSGYYGLLQTDGDCAIFIPCDFQVPLSVIPPMLEKWENGTRIVCLVKKNAQENKLLWGVRQLFYTMSGSMSDTTVIRNFTGSGLYDKTFLDLCRSINDPIATLMLNVSTLGYDMEIMPYEHVKRRSGKSKNNLFTLIDIAITRFTNSSSIGPHYATVGGFFIAGISFLVGLIYLILKLLFWNNFAAGMAPILIGVFFMGAVQLTFIGLVGEYAVKANQRLMKRPLVVERERLNFDANKEE